MKDCVIKRYYFNDIEGLYPELYRNVFKETNSRQVPSYVYLVHSGEEFVGMVTAYIHTTDTIYIQMAGFTEEFKGYKAVGIFRQVIDSIHEDYDNIIFRVQNTHIAALKMSLNAGFIPIGQRGDGMIENGIFKGKLYIELVKNKIKEE